MHPHNTAPSSVRQSPAICTVHTAAPKTVQNVPLHDILAGHLTRLQAVHQAGQIINCMEVYGWSGPYYNPNRRSQLPSLWLKQPTKTEPGAYVEQETSESGTLPELAVQLGIEPKTGRPQTSTFKRRTWEAVRARFPHRGTGR